MVIVINITIRKRIREIMQLKGYFQQELANEIGIAMNSLYHYEKNRKMSLAKVIANIAKALNVSADYLLGLSGNPVPKDDSFDLSDYFQDSVKQAPEKLIEIGNQLIKLGRKMKEDLENK